MNHELTNREREVVELVAAGFKQQQIAEEMSISRSTIEMHLSNIYDKLGVRSMRKLIIWAYQSGLKTCG